MSTDPIATLREEHVAMSSLLAVLAGMARKLRDGSPVPRDDFRDALTVVSEFGDRCHHAKEEILFARVARAAPEVGGGLVRRLKGDHRALRGLASVLSEGIRQGLPTKASRLHLSKLFTTYARVLRDHIRLEEDLLLVEVERTLRSEERARIQLEFERMEREDLGLGMMDAYRSIIRRLAETYPQPDRSTAHRVAGH